MNKRSLFEATQGHWSIMLHSLWLLLLVVLGCSAQVTDAKQNESAEETAAVASNALTKAAVQVAATKAAKASTSLPAGQRDVWVVLKGKATVSAAKNVKGWKAKGDSVVKSLTTTAKASQSSLLSFLSTHGVTYKPYWIVNAVKVTADDATIAQISQRTDVARVFDDFNVSIPDPIPGATQRAIDAVEWNIANVRAPEAWADFGTRGEGIVVATIDTGVEFDHPALLNHYRGHGADGSLDHNYNWFDPTGICGAVPCDNAGHGTHTMGTIVGDDGGENQVGVAPGATWISAKGCESSSCTTESLVASGQWMLAPTDSNGANPRPDLRPHLVSNSWGGSSGDEFYREIVNAWVAAGIFPVFANGNSGSDCGSANSPGDYPESYGVGAYDINNSIAFFSSRGPSVFGETKPNLSAPGFDVRSSVPGGGYDSFSGTSMATPHVAGAIALLWSAAPAMIGEIALTREILGAGAVNHPDEGCGGDAELNNTWGEGQMDIVASLELAPIGPTGYLAGAVSNEVGDPVIAQLRVTGAANRNVATDTSGAYRVRLPIGSYAVEARAFGYLPNNVPSAVIEEDVTTELNLTLVAAPTFAVSGTVTDGEGLPLAGATVTVTGTPLVPSITDADGFFSFPAVPVGDYSFVISAGGCYSDATLNLTVDSDETLDVPLAQKSDRFGYVCSPSNFDYLSGDTLVLTDVDDATTIVNLPFTFTYYGVSVNSISVTSNGYVSISPNANFFEEPIPTPQEPNGAIFAFWDDLLVLGDGVYTGELGVAPNRQFVIEWRDVRFFADSSQSVSFEIVLNESGTIQTQYAVADSQFASGLSAGVGIEDPSGTDGIQYSFDKAAISSGLSVSYAIPHAGFVQGTVVNSNDGLPVAGAAIVATNDEGREYKAKTMADGTYRLMITQGHYSLSIGSKNYTTGTASITVVEGATVTQNFSLKTAKAVLSPPTIQLVLGPNTTRTRSLTLGNEGSGALQYSVLESGGRRQTTIINTARRTRTPNADPNARTTKGLFQAAGARASLTPSSTGEVIASFPTGLGLGWGIGQANQLWISDIETVTDYEFGFEGERTGNSIATPWAGEWAADMAFDTTRQLVCQLAVGGDNGIHCFDAASGEVVVELTGSPWSDISQRGLAYKSADDTFYVAGWNEGIVYQVAGESHANPGSVISSCSPSDGSISGLAYNETEDVLWAATNSETDTIYELNPNDCTVLATLAPPQGGSGQGAGLEMDEIGNLWAIAQNPNTAYLIDSGVPSAGGDIPWLTVTPTSGELRSGGQQALQVSINTAGLTPGLYLGTVFVQSNSARNPTIKVPVSLVVSGYLQGVNAGGANYVDGNGDTWTADQAHRRGSWGYVQRGSTATTRHAIDGTTEDALYKDQRVDPYAYRFDNVPNGIYEIDFRFAELDNVRIGRRLFDGIVENSMLLPAHDIQYEVGRYAADDQHFFLEVTDGRLDVRLVPRSGSQPPVINALRVTHRPDR